MSLRVYCFDDLERIYDDPERVARLVGRCRDRPAESLLAGGGDDTALGSLAALAQSEAIGGSLPRRTTTAAGSHARRSRR